MNERLGARFALMMIGFACLPCAAQTLASSSDLERYIDQALIDWHTPGLTLAVVHDDRVVLTRGFGVRKRGAVERVDEKTMFALGSASKAFAAATVAMLVDDGEVSLDDRVKSYLPWLELYDPWVTNALTVRDLLVHRVGTSFRDENRLRPLSRDARDLLDRGRWVMPVAPFRADFVYSNNMFIAAGQLVAAVSNKTWTQFARERLWVPLQMTRTGADFRRASADANAASAHTGPLGSEPEPHAWEFPDAVAVPSGGVNSNAQDMAQWLRFQLNEGTIGGRELIRKEVFRQMQTPQTTIRFPARDIEQFPPNVQALMSSSGFWAYGMGWYVTEYRGRKMVWHSGTINGFRAGVGLLPEEGIGVFVGVNRTPSILPFAMMLRVFDDYLDDPPTDWSAVFRAGAAQDCDPK